MDRRTRVGGWIIRAAAWIAVGVGTGGVLGSAASLLYFQLHPDLYYACFMWELNFYPIYPLVLSQGLLEGSIIGLVCSAWAVLLNRGAPQPPNEALTLFKKTVIWLILWASIAGITTACFGVLFPRSYDWLAPLPLEEGPLACARWAFVHGSLWGWYIGAGLYVPMSWHWRRKASAPRQPML